MNAALELLQAGYSPTASALDLIVGQMRPEMAKLTGGWTPSLILNRAASLMDAEMRLGTGGDVRGVALQVAALMLIAIEKLELQT